MATFTIPSYDRWVESVKKQAGEYKADTGDSEDPNNYQLMNALMEREGDFLRVCSECTRSTQLAQYMYRHDK